MLRAACPVALGMCLIGCASDHPGRPLTDVEDRTTVAAPRRELPVCELIGRESIVQVNATSEGTRYTLCTIDGVLIASDLDAAELARLRPDLDPGAMQADWGRGALMMLDLRD